MNRICLILFFNLLVHYCFSQEIVNDVIGMSGDEISNSQININHTSAELVSTTINNSDIILTQGFQQTSNILYLAPRVYLQGALINSPDVYMRDDLREQNYLPPTSPYNNKTTVSDNLFETATNDAIVDWVEIELRNSDNRIVSRKSALVQKDGDIVNSNGNLNIQFTTHNKDYFVVINHRNHLGTMTANQVTLNTNPVSLDFTDGSTPTFGNNAQIQLTSGDYALWAGDTNGTNQIRFSGSNNSVNPIRDYVLTDPANFFNLTTFQSNGYLDIDIDMNGVGRFSGTGADSNLIRTIVLSHPGNFFNLTTYKINGTVTEQ